jgi:hypothetical protein
MPHSKCKRKLTYGEAAAALDKRLSVWEGLEDADLARESDALEAEKFITVLEKGKKSCVPNFWVEVPFRT